MNDSVYEALKTLQGQLTERKAEHPSLTRLVDWMVVHRPPTLIAVRYNSIRNWAIFGTEPQLFSLLVEGAPDDTDESIVNTGRMMLMFGPVHVLFVTKEWHWQAWTGFCSELHTLRSPDEPPLTLEETGDRIVYWFDKFDPLQEHES